MDDTKIIDSLLADPGAGMQLLLAQYGGLIISVLCSLFFNYFYLKKITQQVKIQRYRGHAAAGTQQYYQNLARMGGTSWLIVFLVVIGLLSVSSIVTSLFLI